ncbi:MAG TPA: tetratricopeptide repeat protein [Polyangiaceae bacterium]|jgi:hypothetical protein
MSRPRLAGGVSVVLFSGAICGSLFFLLPEERTFEARETSALSILYVEALLRASPGDLRLRLTLARQRLETGRLEEAYAALQPVLFLRNDLGKEARLLAVQIQLARWRAIPEGDPGREAQREAAVGDLGRATRDRRPPEQLSALAGVALELGNVPLAAALYERLADEDDEQAATWLAKAAHWHLASGDPAGASALFDRAFEEAKERVEAVTNAHDALVAALAAGGGPEAVRLAKKYLQLVGDDPRLLELALRIATTGSDRGWTRDLSMRWLATNGRDRASVMRAVDDEVASGDLRHALDLLLEYLHDHPEDLEAHARAEQIAEWSGRPALALDESRWLARHGRAASLQRAIDLAIMLHDDASLVEMYLLRDRQRRLLDADVLLVAGRFEALGQPERAAAFVADHARHHGDDHTKLWLALAGIEERRGDLEGARAAWAEGDRRHPVTPALAVDYAELVWRAGHAQEALDVLWNHRGAATVKDEDFWERAADLAWELGDEKRAREALVQLLEGRPHDVTARERLLTLARRGGDSAEIEALYERLWKESKEPRYLVAAAGNAEAGGHHARALEILAPADAEPKVRALDTYWSTRGDALVGLGRSNEARTSFDEALARNPWSAHSATAALWLAIDAADLPGIRRYLAQFGARAPSTPSLHGAFAAAFDRLDRPRDALPWYARVARATPNDTSMLLSYADALDRSGLPDRALRLRRYALQKVQPRAMKALRAHAKDSDSARLLKARAILARSLEGTLAGYAWLARAKSVAGDAELEQLAASWYVADDRVELARRWFTQAAAKRQKTASGLRLAFALAVGESSEIEKAVGDMTLSPQERATADLELRREPEALAEIDRALISVEAGADRALVETGATLAERAAPYARGGVSYDSFAVLDSYGPDAAALLQAGHVRLDGAARERTLLSDGRLLRAGSTMELDARLAAAIPWGKTASAEGAIGLNARLAKPLPYADAEITLPLGSGIHARLDGHFDEAPTDNAFLRVDGLRDTVGMTFDADVGAREYLHVAAAAFDESTLGRHLLDVGARANAEVGYRVWRSAPEWRFFGAAGWEGRKLASSLPAEAAAQLADPTASVGSVLPAEVVVVTAGTSVSNGNLNTPWGGGHRFPRYEASVSTGWLWPLNQPVLQARAGVGIPLLGRDQLGVIGYVLTEVSAARGDIFRGASLVYSREL